MADWSIQRKLITGVIVICMLAIVTSAASLVASRILIANMANVATGDARDLTEARVLQLTGVHTIADAQACLLRGGREFAPTVTAGSERVRDLATALQLRIPDEDGRDHAGRVAVVDHEAVAVGQKAKLHAAEDDHIKAGGRGARD